MYADREKLLEKSTISRRDNPLTVRDVSHGPTLSVVILAKDDVGRPGGPTADISQITGAGGTFLPNNPTSQYGRR